MSIKTQKKTMFPYNVPIISHQFLDLAIYSGLLLVPFLPRISSKTCQANLLLHLWEPSRWCSSANPASCAGNGGSLTENDMPNPRVGASNRPPKKTGKVSRSTPLVTLSAYVSWTYRNFASTKRIYRMIATDWPRIATNWPQVYPILYIFWWSRATVWIEALMLWCPDVLPRVIFLKHRVEVCPYDLDFPPVSLININANRLNQTKQNKPANLHMQSNTQKGPPSTTIITPKTCCPPNARVKCQGANFRQVSPW